MSRLIGIDFGTAYSLVAAFNESGKPEAISNLKHPNDSILIPSLLAQMPDGKWVTGWRALEHKTAHPSHVVTSLKSFIKKGWSLDDYFWPFDVRANSGKVNFKVGTQEKELLELVSAIFSELKSRTEDYFGEIIEQAVVSVPACFTSEEKLTVQTAAKKAGFNILGVLEEPAAVALTYAFNPHEDGILAVYDLGAGFFEVMIVEISGGKVKVLASQSSAKIGGQYFDWLIAKKIVEEISAVSGDKIWQNPVLIEQIVEEAEKVKRAVSHRGSYDIRIRNEALGINFDRAFSRFELGNCLREKIEETVPICESVLKQAGVTIEQVKSVILSGGSTRMPLVRDILRKHCGDKPMVDWNPDQPVALGAAIYAEMLAGTGNVKKLSLTY